MESKTISQMAEDFIESHLDKQMSPVAQAAFRGFIHESLLAYHRNKDNYDGYLNYLMQYVWEPYISNILENLEHAENEIISMRTEIN